MESLTLRIIDWVRVGRRQASGLLVLRIVFLRERRHGGTEETRDASVEPSSPQLRGEDYSPYPVGLGA